MQVIRQGYAYLPELKRGPDEGIILCVTSNTGLYPLPTAPVFSGCANGVIGAIKAYGSDRNLCKYNTRLLGAALGLVSGTKFHCQSEQSFCEYKSCYPDQE